MDVRDKDMIFKEIECCKCGVVWGVSPALNTNWLRTKADFYCPNGHGQSYTESTADRLERQLKLREAEILEKDREIVRLTKSIKPVVKRKRVKK